VVLPTPRNPVIILVGTALIGDVLSVNGQSHIIIESLIISGIAKSTFIESLIGFDSYIHFIFF
jgi:hypothetical protein